MRQPPGDEPDWNSLVGEQVARNGPLFFELAYRLLRDSAAAEDACQQAMLKALQAEHGLRGRDSLKAWLARVVINESLQMHRRREIERHAVRSAAATILDKPQAPELDLRETVLEAVSGLPETTRVVVTLRLLHGMSGNQVKDLLSCSAVEVSRQLHRGMELLRHSLSTWETTSRASR